MAAIESKKASVLIVDDNPKNIQVIGSVLQGANYEVGFAINGQQALSILQKNNNYDIVLLDIDMPVMNGFEACIEIRKIENLKELPIIFLTAFSDHESLIKGFDLGAQDYITKPFNAKELLSRVRAHVELKQKREQLENLNEVLEEKVRQRTAELEKANLELSKLDRLKTDFLRMISHEIRTPLNGIMAPIKLLKDQVEKRNLVRLLEIIDESALRLERFSIQALEITDLRSGNYQPNYTHVSSNDLVEFTLLENQASISEKKIDVDLKAVEPFILCTDSELFLKALVNILRNAITYSPENAIIEIKATRNEEFFCFIILDHGQGMNKEKIGNLFKLFAPGEAFVDKNRGLGLFFTQLIMETLSGKIQIESKEGEGTKVSLFLPTDVHSEQL